MIEVDGRLYGEGFRSVEAPAILVDTDLEIKDISEGGIRFLEYEYDEIVGESVAIFSADQSILTDVVDTVAGGEAWSGDFKAETKSGRIVVGQGSVAPVIVDGDIEAFVGVFIDTTKQRRYANAAEVLNRLLRHDLRNDLNVVHAHLQQVESRIDDETGLDHLREAKERISTVVRRSERARHLRSLLEETYGESSYPVRLDRVLNDSLVDAIEEHDGAEFRFDVFPEVAVTADDLLSTVFEAVLENAVDHNDADDPIVEVTVEEDESSVLARIDDNGPGIPPEQRDLVFGREEYDQLHHGSGISLFFVDTVIDSYNGDVWIDESDLGGARVNIRLQKAEAGDEPGA